MVYDEITPTVGSKQPASGYVTSLPDFLAPSLYPIWLLATRLDAGLAASYQAGYILSIDLLFVVCIFAH